MNLSDLSSGESAIIVKVNGKGNFRKRLTEMGFVKGQRVTVVKNAPLRDPIEYMIMDYEISLRRSEASMVEVSHSEQNDKQNIVTPKVFEQMRGGDGDSKQKKIRVALIGNPNCGKTTLFNYISGLHEHVGNYSGVTIDAKSAVVEFGEYKIEFTDLPGAYSLSAYSPEEVFVRDHIVNQHPDVIVNVVDATNLERNLYLTTQLIDIDATLVIALNMFDEFQKSGDRLDTETLSNLLNAPVIPTVAKRHRGVQNLMSAIVDQYNAISLPHKSVQINYGQYNHDYIDRVQVIIQGKNNTQFSDRFFAIKLLEGDALFYKEIDQTTAQKVKEQQNALQDHYGEVSETVFTDARYGFVSGALKETLRKGSRERNKQTRAIDSVLTNKYLSFPIFIGIMWVMFYGTFTLGEYPMMLIEYLVEQLQYLLQQILPQGAVNDLITNGIVGGVGSVIVFLPNILILFLFISILEDTGYMSRAAFIMDKIMHRIGLHGKSFIPMLMGFGCNVPAVMATRIIENRDNRILTMLITPFMSCSAKLPVYILFLGTFFPNSAGNMLFAIYLLGIALAALTAIIFNKFVFKGKDKPFVMELPPYRMPYFRSSMKHMWQKGSQYLKKMGGVILIAVVVIWVLSYFPQNSELQRKYSEERVIIENLYNQQLAINPTAEALLIQKDSTLHAIDNQYAVEKLAGSYLASIGKSIEPVIAPLGFDWKMGVCLTAGIAAKEIIVSTMGVIYNIDTDHEEGLSTLQNNLLNETYKDGDLKGEKVYSMAVGLSFLVFTLIYFPCLATVAAIRRESGATKWMIFSMLYSTALAWIMSFVVYNIAKLF